MFNTKIVSIQNELPIYVINLKSIECVLRASDSGNATVIKVFAIHYLFFNRSFHVSLYLRYLFNMQILYVQFILHSLFAVF